MGIWIDGGGLLILGGGDFNGGLGFLRLLVSRSMVVGVGSVDTVVVLV